MNELSPNNENMNVEGIESPPKKKRGRKPKQKGYFQQEQEEAFRLFLTETDIRKRDRIFADKIYPALCKMVECLIRRYMLFSVDESYEDTFNDTLSFLMTKVQNFKPDIGKKAYSYCGTVCKNYLILKRSQSQKKQKMNISYDMLYPTEENHHITDEEPVDDSLPSILIERTRKEIEDILDENSQDHYLSENERKVGEALLYLLTNWEKYIDPEGSRKYNKLSILYFIKEYTLCTTSEVRRALKVYKDLYLFTKEYIISKS